MRTKVRTNNLENEDVSECKVLSHFVGEFCCNKLLAQHQALWMMDAKNASNFFMHCGS